MPPAPQRQQTQGGGGNSYQPDFDPLVFEQFNGINTSTTRPGVDDAQMAWCDGFFPIAPRQLRTLYDVGTALWTPSGVTIAYFNFANIGATPYLIGLTSDGAVWAVNTDTAVANQIAPAGTIDNPSRQTSAISQYGSQYVIIVSSQTNGYFIWDGTNFYIPGSVGPTYSITDGGTGYTSAPTVTIEGGEQGGIEATATATITNGVVTALTITNPGTKYVSPIVAFSGGGGSGAAATIDAVPMGISGTAIEIYSGRVWIADGATINFSVAGSVTDFSTGDGGGSFTSSDSFLRVQFSALIQTNGFLYLIADSSINYISGVQTTGSPPTTTFTNQNADPEIGTVWPGTVDVLSRNIIFANAFGVHVSYGAAVSKVSDPLDGVYNSVANFGGNIPSAAKSIIFGKKVWILLITIVDPVTSQQVNKLFLWDSKKWFSSNQSVSLTYIQHQEINSVLTAYGTDGHSVYPLFNTPSDFLKTVQSRFWDRPVGQQEVKATNRVWGMVQYYDLTNPALSVSVDSEGGSNISAVDVTPSSVTWLNASAQIAQWSNASSVIVSWFSTGLAVVVLPPKATGQQGVLLGLTISTESFDLAIISFMLAAVPVQYRG